MAVAVTIDGLPAEEVAARLAEEAQALSGAGSVSLYLWDSENGFLYEAATTGPGRQGLPSAGLALGHGAGFMFLRACKPTAPLRSRLKRFAQSAGRCLQQTKETRTLPLLGAEEATVAFVSALRAKSPLTGEHCLRVARYVAVTALALDLPEAEICHVERCGLLHDIGKLAIADDILEKPGALSADEWALIRAHPQMGARTLQPSRSLARILPAVTLHHERFDGTGYPYGVSAENIPLEARIVNLCDAYDTMTSDRPYRKALAPDEAAGRLRAGSGTQFDPAVVHAFTRRVLPTLSNGLLHRP